jgi:hypothetical protein
MADKKISALTAASTPLAGTEVLPIVQGGSTVKVSVANLTAGRATAFAGATSTAPILVQSATFGQSDITAETTAASSTGFSRVILKTADREWRIVNDASTVGSPFLLYDVQSAATALTVDSSGNFTANRGNVVIGTAAKGIDFSANTHAAGMTSELLNWYEEGACSMTVTAISGTITTGSVTAIYTRVGRSVTVTGTVSVSDNGTGAGALTVSGLPFTPSGNACGVGRESVNNGKTVSFMVSGGSTAMSVQAYDNTYPVSSGSTILFSVTYTV